MPLIPLLAPNLPACRTSAVIRWVVPGDSMTTLARITLLASAAAALYAQGTRIDLKEGWTIQSSAKVTQAGAEQFFAVAVV